MDVAMMSPVSTAQFEALLRHLGPDRDAAGRQYEQLRQRLLTIFTYRHCAHPEDLADETMDRVARRLLEMGERFEGSDPARFVFGVAWNVARESFHRNRDLPLPGGWDMADSSGPADETDDGSREASCLERCLARLADADRRLVLRYFQEEKRAKITERSALARELRISPNALRLRIHRLSQQLRDCVGDCLDEVTPRPMRVR